MLELIDHSRCLTQLDDTGYTVHEHLRTVRFGNKVRCAVSQCGDFVFFTAALCHHDHRYKGQLLIILYAIQKGVTVHHRHHDIEQDQGNAVRILLQDIKRLLSVFRLQHLVFAGQNLTQNRTIQFIIFYNQNLLFHNSTSLIPSSSALICSVLCNSFSA